MKIIGKIAKAEKKNAGVAVCNGGNCGVVIKYKFKEVFHYDCGCCNKTLAAIKCPKCGKRIIV